ncbi:MAG: type II secretion system GspH family protein [Rhodocyclaceae bacterium]|nr:type II secretion system GspH family protein [Rhodocyclaceae bacterium]
MTFCRKKSVSAGRRPRQSGAALLIFLLVLMAGALAYLVSNLTSSEIEARRAQKTQQALSQAREALIGYALRYREDQMADGQYDRVYGYLPLPDLGTTRNNNAGCGNEGCDAANFAGNALNTTVIGRLPWRTLGIEPLRDAYGECLWYAVSGSHQNQQRVSPMNWDALGQVDIVDTNKPIETSALKSRIASAHDRPIAIIFSAGPPVGIQNRGPAGGDDVARCGGNYDPQHYLDPGLAAALLDYAGAASASTYFAGVRAIDTSATDLAISTQGRVFADGATLKAACPAGSTNCTLAGNDAGLPLTGDTLFAAIRKHAYFRTDINAMLDRITDCLRDQAVPGGNNKIAGADNDACYGSGVVPRGYYPHYKDMLYVAGDAPSVNGNACAGGLLFGSQRATGQLRDTAGNRALATNYLEAPNLLGPYSGPELFERISATQTGSQDIVRCIPSTPSFVTSRSPGLALAGLPQLASYDAGTRTLTLGQGIAAALGSGLANYLYGCAWRPETHTLGGGLRSYFTFRINDAGGASWPTLGFSFTVADGDNNEVDLIDNLHACGAAAQHLGYSGNNTESPYIAPPKVAFEVDLRRETGFNPALANRLLNGRNDPPSPSYRGGHVAIDYWGGETSIDTTLLPPCTAPAFDSGGTCHLPQEEDDNVHARTPFARSGFPAPPANPTIPAVELAVPPDSPAGAYKLDPALTATPTDPDFFHVRLELTRSAADYSLPRVRVASTGNIDIALPGTAIDNVYLFAGDRILLKDQTVPAQNGVYVWQAANQPLTRADDADTPAELAGRVVEVRQGTANARGIWRQNATSLVLGTTALSWTNIRVKLAAPATTTIASPGAELDGIRMKTGDRVLIKTVGLYIWNGAAVPMTVASDIAPGSVVQIQQGAEASAWWRYDGAAWQRLSVRVASQSNLDLAAPGAGIDGIAMAAGDRVLVKNQTVPAENGIYQWNGAAVAMGRATDADASAELAGALTQVLDGSDVGRAFRQTTLAATGTIDVSPVQWIALDRSTRYLLEVWLLLDSPSYTDKIAAMKDTTRPMRFLYPAFTPHLQDWPVIPYSFRNARLGFTIGQRTSINDQTVSIMNSFTSWLE